MAETTEVERQRPCPLVDRALRVIGARTGSELGSAACLVTGPPGVGKTEFLGAVGAQLGAAGCDVEILAGVRAASSLPLTPFAHLFDEAPTGTDVRDRLAGLRSQLVERARAGGFVLVVDDAHLLDAPSMALVHRLIASDRLAGLVAARSTEAIPPDLAALGRLPGSEWLELVPLDRAGSDRLVARLVGRRVSARVLDEVWRLCRGTPAYIRDLVDAAIDSSLIGVERPADWPIAGALGASPRLSVSLSEQLDGLGDGREMAIAVAVGGPLPEDLVVAAFGVERLRRALLSGAVSRMSSTQRTQIEVANGLLREALLAETSDFERTRVIRHLVTFIGRDGAVGSDGPVDGDEVLLRAELCRLGGLDDAEAFESAAVESLRRHDPRRALDDATNAVRLGGGPSARLAMARALSQLRRCEEADRIFAGLERESADPAFVVQVRHRRVLSNIFDRADFESAAALLETALVETALLGDEPMESTALTALEAQHANVRFYSGDSIGAVAVADAIEGRGHELTFDALPAVLNALIGLGRPLEVLDRIESRRGVSATDLVRPIGGSSIATLHMLALWQVGRVPDITEPFEGMPQVVTATMSDSWLTQRAVPATLSLITGRPLVTVRPIGSSAEESPVHPLHPLIGDLAMQAEAFFLAVLATTEARRGDIVAARSSLARIGALPSMATAGLRWWVDRASVALLIAEGRLGDAVERSILLGRHHFDEPFFATTSLHDVVRLGRSRRVVGELRRQASRDGATWWDQVCADHASAASAGDADHLVSVGRRFEAGGLLGDALIAFQQAAALDTGAGVEVNRVAVRCGDRRPPGAATLVGGLTPRELSVGRLAAAGQSNAQIAVSLGTSSRTVGNQLQSVYEKLGVHSRRALGPLIGEGPINEEPVNGTPVP